MSLPSELCEDLDLDLDLGHGTVILGNRVGSANQ